MEPILDEISLVPCESWSPATRVLNLAETLRALDGLGAPRVLRSVRDAADRDIRNGCGLRTWCVDRATPRDAGLLLLHRLTRQPFIDGQGGLFDAAEGTRVVEAKVLGVKSLGAGLAALTDGVIAPLAAACRPTGGMLTVDLTYLEDAGLRTEPTDVLVLASADEVEQRRQRLVELIDRSVANGKCLLVRLGELFPRLRLGSRAEDQISALTGNEPVFRQLLRHLRVLDLAALQWPPGESFKLTAVTWSVESPETLNHRKFGPMRNFPVPAGFRAEKWSSHTKLTGGAGARLYFRAVRMGDEAVVLVGYFGDHLPTVKYST